MKTLDAYECEGQISLMDDTGNIKQLLPGSMPTLETRAEANESVDREKRYAQIIEILTEHPNGRTAKEIFDRKPERRPDFKGGDRKSFGPRRENHYPPKQKK